MREATVSIGIFGRIVSMFQNLLNGEPVSRSGVLILAVCGVVVLLCLIVGWLYFRRDNNA